MVQIKSREVVTDPITTSYFMLTISSNLKKISAPDLFEK